MKKAIDKIIDEEMKEKEDRLNIGLQTVINERKRPITMIDLDLLNEDEYRKKRIQCMAVACACCTWEHRAGKMSMDLGN